MINNCFAIEYQVNKELPFHNESLFIYQWDIPMMKMFNEIHIIVFDGLMKLMKYRMKAVEENLDIKAKNQFKQTYKSRIMAIGSHFLQYMVPIFIFDFIFSF